MVVTRNLRVLLIAPAGTPFPQRLRDGARIEVIRTPSVAAAAGLAAQSFDAIVLEPALAGDAHEAIQQLLVRSPGAAPLFLTEHADSGIPEWCTVVPPTTTPASQAEILRLAVECARSEQELARTESRFRDVIERNADAIVVMDREGTILLANAAAAKLFGRRQAELVGSPFGYPVTAGETTELDLPGNGEPRVIEMRVVESEWEGGASCIASLRDITDRKRAEQDARRLIREQAARTVAEAAARRFRFLAESSTVLTASLDYATTLSELARLCVSEIADWAVVYISEEGDRVRRLEVAHRDPARASLARTLRDLPITAGGHHPVLEVLRTRRPILVEDVDEARLASISEDPQHRELIRSLGIDSFMMVPLTARGRSLGAIALVSADPDRPLTGGDLELAEDLALRAALAVDNARLYRAAQDANQGKSDLFAAISHDLRTPLNSIMGHADLLSMGIPDTLSDASLRHVERIGKSAAHLLHLIDELTTLVRLDAGREELHLAAVNVSDVVNDVNDVVELLAVDRGLAFAVDVADPQAVMNTDPARLRQVLLNLIGNAIKYTEEGEVRLTVRVEGEVITFRISDTGVGIAPGDLPRIFEPFWQADPSRRRSAEGTGLGLSVVHRLVKLLRGTIEVESELGAGSAFTVTLPLHGPEDESAEAATASVGAADAHRTTEDSAGTFREPPMV
ncbi:MAG TPA: PAS domain-containing sensor histidine kinase [Longimicrobiales bacterium]